MKLLERHFEMALAAPDGIKKLRELILTLAMQGKLVPQDPADPPVSELLKEIEAEKRRLVKEGKLKKQEPLPPIKPEEVPYEVPAGWEWVRVQDLGFVLGGKRIPKGYDFSNVPTPYRYLTVTNMKDGSIIDNNEKYIDGATRKAIEKYIITKEDIYITIAGTIGMVGSIPDRYDGMNLTENASRLIFFEANKNFLVDLLSSHIVQSQFHELTNKMAQPKLALRSILGTLIPLPPLAEQKRIVAKIDQLMVVCDKLEVERNERNQKRLLLHRTAMNPLLSAADAPSFAAAWSFIVRNFNVLYSVPENVVELKKTILQLAMMGKLVPQDLNDPPASELLKQIEAEKKKLLKEGKIKKQVPLPPIKPEEVPYEVPAGWEWVRLGDAIFNAMTGIDRGKSLQSIEYQYPYFKMNNISNVGSCDYTQVTNINASQDERNRYSLSDGDFLFNTRNSAELVGKTCVFSRPDEENWLYNNNILKIEFSPFVDNWFANRWFNSTIGKNELNKIKSATTNVAAIYQGKLMNFLLPFPPLAEQKRIVAKVDALMALCDELEQQLKDATSKQTDILNAAVAGTMGRSQLDAIFSTRIKRITQ